VDPASLITEDKACVPGDFGCDLVEMELRGFAVAGVSTRAASVPCSGQAWDCEKIAI
jgi:hypothetical protein